MTIGNGYPLLVLGIYLKIIRFSN